MNVCMFTHLFMYISMCIYICMYMYIHILFKSKKKVPPITFSISHQSVTNQMNS